jgi:hypothetical protein
MARPLPIPKGASNKEARRIVEINNAANRAEQEARESEARRLLETKVVDERTPLDAQGRPMSRERVAEQKKAASLGGMTTAVRNMERRAKQARKKASKNGRNTKAHSHEPTILKAKRIWRSPGIEKPLPTDAHIEGIRAKIKEKLKDFNPHGNSDGLIHDSERYKQINRHSFKDFARGRGKDAKPAKPTNPPVKDAANAELRAKSRARYAELTGSKKADRNYPIEPTRVEEAPPTAQPEHKTRKTCKKPDRNYTIQKIPSTGSFPGAQVHTDDLSQEVRARIQAKEKQRREEEERLEEEERIEAEKNPRTADEVHRENILRRKHEMQQQLPIPQRKTSSRLVNGEWVEVDKPKLDHGWMEPSRQPKPAPPTNQGVEVKKLKAKGKTAKRNLLDGHVGILTPDIPHSVSMPLAHFEKLPDEEVQRIQQKEKAERVLREEQEKQQRELKAEEAGKKALQRKSPMAPQHITLSPHTKASKQREQQLRYEQRSQERIAKWRKEHPNEPAPKKPRFRLQGHPDPAWLPPKHGRDD